MGYCSNVALSMYKKDYDKMIELNEKNMISDNLIELAEKHIFTDSDDNVIVLYWDSVKWYPEYSDVKAVEDYLCTLREQDRPYNFIRIGEGWDDIEYSCHYSDIVDNDVVIDKINLYRAIDIDG